MFCCSAFLRKRSPSNTCPQIVSSIQKLGLNLLFLQVNCPFSQSMLQVQYLLSYIKFDLGWEEFGVQNLSLWPSLDSPLNSFYIFLSALQIGFKQTRFFSAIDSAISTLNFICSCAFWSQRRVGITALTSSPASQAVRVLILMFAIPTLETLHLHSSIRGIKAWRSS